MAGAASSSVYQTAFLLCGARDDNRSPVILGNGSSGQCLPVARALWARRKVLRGSGSAPDKEQYGHEEYAQNFDEGAAAVEPENLARYARWRLAR